jgi:hypothetical protein
LTDAGTDAGPNYCDSLNCGSQTDWWLSNPFELESIVDNQKFGPSTDTTKFPGTPNEFFWSSSSDASNYKYAWLQNFFWGTVFTNSKSLGCDARCVRLGPTEMVDVPAGLFHMGCNIAVDSDCDGDENP